MDAVVPPPTSGGSRTTTSSYDVRITDKMNMKNNLFPSYDVCFMTTMDNQYIITFYIYCTHPLNWSSRN